MSNKFDGTGVQIAFAQMTKLTAGGTLPLTTLSVEDASAFPATGSVTIGAQTITYTGKTATTLTGCTGGTGAVVAGADVTSTTFDDLSCFAKDFGEEESTEEWESSAYCDGKNKRFDPGQSEATAKFTVLHDNGPYLSSAQYKMKQLRSKICMWRVRERGTGTGKGDRVFPGFITKRSSDMPQDDAVSSELEIRYTSLGDVVDTVQA